MSKPEVTISTPTEYHHMPARANLVDVQGMTPRQALHALRSVEWGDLGGTYSMELSDGSTMKVELSPSHGGGRLMGSQRAVRSLPDRQADYGERVVATYPIR